MRLIPFLVAFSALALSIRLLTLTTDQSQSLLPSVAAAAQEVPAEDEDQDQEDKDDQDSGDNAGDETGDQTGDDAPTSSLPAGDGLDFTSLATCSDEDIRLVEQLRQRRLDLEKRESELEIRENLLLATEFRIQESTADLQRLEEQIKAHLKLFDEREQTQLQRVVEVYGKMNAKDAAPRFQRLPLDIQVDLATIMAPKKVADIIAEMDNDQAVELTERLATIASAPTIDDVQSAGSR